MSKKPLSQGKGDKRRPSSIDRQQFEQNWDTIFNKDKKSEPVDKTLDKTPKV